MTLNAVNAKSPQAGSPPIDRLIGQALPARPHLAIPDALVDPPSCLDRDSQVYPGPMTRFFDIADHDRLPQRFTALDRSVLARL
jgi:hypothetical protein